MAYNNKELLKTSQNLNEISFYFFFIFGIIHIISGLLLVNNYLTKTNWLINKLLDIPFFLCFLIYFYSSLKISLINNDNYTRSIDFFLITVFSSFGTIIFLADITFSNILP